MGVFIGGAFWVAFSLQGISVAVLYKFGFWYRSEINFSYYWYDSFAWLPCTFCYCNPFPSVGYRVVNKRRKTKVNKADFYSFPWKSVTNPLLFVGKSVNIRSLFPWKSVSKRLLFVGKSVKSLLHCRNLLPAFYGKMWNLRQKRGGLCENPPRFIYDYVKNSSVFICDYVKFVIFALDY